MYRNFFFPIPSHLKIIMRISAKGLNDILPDFISFHILAGKPEIMKKPIPQPEYELLAPSSALQESRALRRPPLNGNHRNNLGCRMVVLNAIANVFQPVKSFVTPFLIAVIVHSPVSNKFV